MSVVSRLPALGSLRAVARAPPVITMGEWACTRPRHTHAATGGGAGAGGWPCGAVRRVALCLRRRPLGQGQPVTPGAATGRGVLVGAAGRGNTGGGGGRYQGGLAGAAA